ncbi:hypothetical protein SK128_024772 [Halocaridina rubra]|uniref:TRPM SLOG domain-containing protein n=1 Tax=Halocaridina rubra TaxID=373956 RepID=A0AAN8WP97_HALRR
MLRNLKEILFTPKVKGGIVLQIKCIGVVPFGRIRDVFSFVKGGNSIHTGINLKSEATPVHDCHPPALNEDHTHLLLVDDGFSYDKSNAESFRSSLLDAIQVERPSGLGIPAVVLVLDGGVSALRECLMALQCNTPVMVVEGTGRAADLLAYAASRYSSPIVRNGKVVAEQELNEDQRKEVFDQVSRFMPELREDECLVSLLRFHDGRAALTDQLELALQWNRVDVAEEKIFPQFQCTGEETILLNKIMTKAILDQKQDFIELLLQRDVIMSQYLNVGVLRQLYNSIRPRYHFGHLIRKSPDEEIYLRDVHLLLQRLVGKHDHHLYVNDIENSHQDKAQFEDPYLELLLWAVLSRRDHLAVYLWQKCQSPLRALIVATCLYKSMEESVSAGDTMLKEAYSKMRWTFEGYAVELLERCYKKDHAKAVRLMEEVNGRWGEICLLDIALSAGNMRLVSTACCQDRVAQRWRKLRVKPSFLGKSSMDAAPCFSAVGYFVFITSMKDLDLSF